jgi:hypothetical protein
MVVSLIIDEQYKLCLFSSKRDLETLAEWKGTLDS